MNCSLLAGFLLLIQGSVCDIAGAEAFVDTVLLHLILAWPFWPLMYGPLLSLGARKEKSSLMFCYFSHPQNMFEIHLSLRSLLALPCEEKRASSVIYNSQSTILYANCSWFGKTTFSTTSNMIYEASCSKRPWEVWGITQMCILFILWKIIGWRISQAQESDVSTLL